jgi:isopenicillin N synthase-like dioxygenase
MPSTTQLDPALRGLKVSLAEIPLIDLAPFLHGTAESRAATAAKIGEACQNIGFFYIQNHGIPESLIARTYAEAKRFFALPEAQKAEIAIENSLCHRGWFKLGGENLDPTRQTDGDLKEGLKIGHALPPDHPLVLAKTPLHGPNQWPTLPGFRATMEEYFNAVESLGRTLLGAFALALNLPESHFTPFLTTPMTTLGPLHYPPQSGHITEAKIGAGAHTDYGCLTLLSQDSSGGLQARTKSGTWIDAPPLPGTFVVNIGDMMERWTNGHFTSTLHRVINTSGHDRYSLPFFFDPDFTTPVASLIPGEPPKYPPTTAGQHLLDKINQSFSYYQEK